MLNKMKIVLAGAAAVAAMSSTAAYADSESATASVVIVDAVELTKYDDLYFGTVAAGSASDDIVINAATGARNCGALTCGDTPTRARFQVTSAGQGFVVAISVDPTVTLEDQANVGADMIATLSTPTTSITFDSATLEDIFVGGSLAVAANQAAGTYDGAFDLTAEYQ